MLQNFKAAYGSLIRPTFEKVLVQYGIGINLTASQRGVHLPMDKSSIVQKAQATETKGATYTISKYCHLNGHN